ncbi:carbohydrate sulfotransferase 3-like [Branchiostoma floridae]|uniref:Carbohydrate sulfotransferase 3-like n=1 Tax=Branchiostoma floridae TaxID=7739 RepID=C3YEH5_BRAFL|nr:carbohydrate sulfotransferase 3-like [Branchiostoma floridae]|eukprot:XP_002605267.1 hypothetical protein BRAFLDRAFT_95898 [Branchiostoma floridae]
MFNQHPDFFYMFEPLHPLEVARAREPTERLEARILNDVISCNFSAWESHFKIYLKDEDFGGWKYSRDIRQACSISEKYFKLSLDLKKSCPILDQDILAVLRAICVRRKHLAVTLAHTTDLSTLLTPFGEPQGTPSPVRGGLTAEDARLLREEGLYPVISGAGGEPALRTSLRPDIRLLLLLRDPRDVVTARLRQLYGNVNQFQPGHVAVARPQDYCDWVLAITRSDPTSTHGGPHGLQGRFAVVRHEDVMDRPVEIVRKVYRFVGVPLPRSVVKWLQTDTGDERTSRDMFSSRRNSQEPGNGWQTALSFAAINEVQNIASCRTVMAMFGYKFIRHVADLNRTATNPKGEKHEDFSTA